MSGRKAAGAVAKPSRAKTGKSIQVRDRRSSDGLVNIVQGVGVGAGNSLSAGRYQVSRGFTRMELEAMYDASWIVGKVIDAVAKDMTRAGITIQSGASPEDSKKVLGGLTRLGLWRSTLNNIRWGRLYGGSIAFMNIDAQNPATPLRIETIGRGQLKGLRVYDRHQVVPDVNNLVQDGLHEGTPKFYSIMSAVDPKAERLTIHHSRCIRAIGHELPPYMALQQELWGGPIVGRFFDRLLAFDTGTMGAANLIDRAYLRTVNIDGLRSMIGEDSEAEKDLMRMFQLMAILQRNQGITLLDKEDEFEAHSYTFAGLDDVLLAFGQQLSGASDIPLTKLFGQAPKGLNATGDSDVRNYYDGIASQQENDLRDGLDTVLRVAHASILGKPAPEELEFIFNPLWQMSANEKAEVAQSIATTVQIAVGFGLPLSVALEELQQQSEETGIFTNITDELIKSMEIPPPPPPAEESLAVIEAFVEGDPIPGAEAASETPIETIENFAGTGPMAKIRRFIGMDRAARE